MTYQEVMDYMYSQLPMFHRIGSSAYKANLDTALYMDDYFGFPHKGYKTIHVAGTNGKGSVSHMLASILQTAGYKTGLFTSPHLQDFRERVKVNGVMISKEEVIDFISQHKPMFDKVNPSFFEMNSALAFYYFSKNKVDVAIIEVGMGGRLDSTNIIMPVLSIITNIGMDHTEFLGETLGKIASEKAGIIKKHVPVVIGEYHPDTLPIFQDFAKRSEADILLADETYQIRHLSVNSNGQSFNVYKDDQNVYENLRLDLAGLYQQKNINTALTAVDQLQKIGFSITRQQLFDALSNVMDKTGLQGRWQTIGNNPLIICDTGHNTEGIAWVVQQIKTIPFNQLHMVIGFVKDKDISSILTLLPRNGRYYFTNADIPRALKAEELKNLASSFDLHGESYPRVKEALAAAKANALKEDFIFVGGSTFVVAEVF
jgi:dihydrofolate synthase / folylpolyglutamate synthase